MGPLDAASDLRDGANSMSSCVTKLPGYLQREVITRTHTRSHTPLRSVTTHYRVSPLQGASTAGYVYFAALPQASPLFSQMSGAGKGAAIRDGDSRPFLNDEAGKGLWRFCMPPQPAQPCSRVLSSSFSAHWSPL
jgi:hypothetical protein